MKREDILKQVNEIFVEVLENPSVKLNETTKADDIAEWDSLTHIQLVVTLERHFNMRFTTNEIQGWNSVGEMLNTIEAKLS